MTALLAALAATVAVLLVLPPPPRVGPPAADRGGSWVAVVRRRPTAGVAALVAALVGGLLVTVDGVVLGLGLIVVGGVAGGAALVARSRGRRAASARADRVVEVCEALAAELRAGQPPLSALRHCVEVWPDIEPVARAGDLGSDVPAAFRRLARAPGASGLRDVAAAWQVSQSSGGTMAIALARVADTARRRRATERLVAGELASAQATARLVAVLPVVVLAMGSGLGGDPWGFLVSTPVGLVCLGAGTALMLAGLAWIERIAASVVGR
ncbi:type II secretion system F family protein [Nocardioides pakistanensis]